MASAICVTAIPASAGGYYEIVLEGVDTNGCNWAISLHENFEEGWNEAIYYATHLEEAWNSAERYETEAEREEGAKGFVRIEVTLYGDWNADSNGSLGSGIGFKDGAIYIPKGASITVNLAGNTINRGVTNSKAIYVDSELATSIRNGTVLGGIGTGRSAKVSLRNINLTEYIGENGGYGYSASIFSEGSLAMIVAILALVSSVVSICMTVVYNKKRVATAAACCDEKAEDEE